MNWIAWKISRIPSALLPNTEEAHALCILALAFTAGIVLGLAITRLGDWMVR